MEFESKIYMIPKYIWDSSVAQFLFFFFFNLPPSKRNQKSSVRSTMLGNYCTYYSSYYNTPMLDFFEASSFKKT